MLKHALVTFALLSSACSQVGTIETRTPLAADVGRSKTLGVTVTSKTDTASADLDRIGQRVAERVTESGRFREVSATKNVDTTRDLTLLVQVLTLPEGGFWDRSIFGEGEAKFEVTVIDRAADRPIGACLVGGKASRGTLWSSAGGRAMDEAIQKVAECVTRP